MKNAKKFCILRLFVEELLIKDYSTIQKLYEVAGITNSMLVLRLHSKRTIGVSFTEIIFSDIAYILAEQIIDNPELEEIFRSIYTNKYPLVCEQAAQIIDCVKNKLNGKFGRITTGKEVCFYKYLIYDADVLADDQIKLSGVNPEEDAYMYIYSFASTDCENFINQIENTLHFDGTDESIFASSLFEKYLKKRREALAEYLGVKEKDLDDKITKNMMSKSNSIETPLEPTVEGEIKAESRAIVARQNGGVCWYEMMTCENRKQSLYRYKPDSATIIRDYYISFLLTQILKYQQEKQPFTKLVLSRECVRTPEEDLRNIYRMHEMDVFYQMFSFALEEIYRNFSWEHFTGQKMSVRYEKIIEELNSIIMQQKNKLQVLTEKNTSLEIQCQKDSNKAIREYVTENDRLVKKVENQQNEIIRLKEYIKSQDEFLSELSKEEPEPESEVDLGTLKEKRYLFVGFIDEALPELKKQFPDSIFMNTETMSLNGITVDGIVFLIKYMSHSLYYKVKSSKVYRDVPCAMCNTKNLDRIYYDMYKNL